METLATLALAMPPLVQTTDAELRQMSEETLYDEIQWSLFNIEEVKKLYKSAKDASQETTVAALKEILKRLKKYRNRLIDAMQVRAMDALNNLPGSDSAGYEACSDW